MKHVRYLLLIPAMLGATAAFAACGKGDTYQCLIVRNNQIVSRGSCQSFVCSNMHEHIENIDFGQYHLFSRISIGNNRFSASINNSPAILVNKHHFGSETQCIKPRYGNTMICLAPQPPEEAGKQE